MAHTYRLDVLVDPDEHVGAMWVATVGEFLEAAARRGFELKGKREYDRWVVHSYSSDVLQDCLGAYWQAVEQFELEPIDTVKLKELWLSD